MLEYLLCTCNDFIKRIRVSIGDLLLFILNQRELKIPSIQKVTVDFNISSHYTNQQKWLQIYHLEPFSCKICFILFI